MFVEHVLQPSLDEHSQHQIIYGKLSITIPSPPPYKRTVWDYSKAETEAIKDEILGIDEVSRFIALSSDEMTECFIQILVSTVTKSIPSKVVDIDDKDPSWITPGLKTAIRRKHQVYKRLVQRGRRQEDWALVKNVRNETSN